VGFIAGYTSQGIYAVAMGREAGETSQGDSATAVGRRAGETSQGASATAVGRYAGYDAQGDNATAVGNTAGQTSQGASAVAVGVQAGQTGQGASATAVGNQAGMTGQGTEATAVGLAAGQYNQGAYAVAVGVLAGQTSQGIYAVAVGRLAGETSQGSNATAVGYLAGQYNQGAYAVAVGVNAGKTSQGRNAVAVGIVAGSTGQGTDTVAVGHVAGYQGQGASAVAVGVNAGRSSQGASAVAVGQQAGIYNQGANAVAVGYAAGQTSQSIGSIVINATGGTVNNNAGASCVIKPISAGAGNADLRYSTGNGLVTYLTSDDRVKDNEVFVTDATRSLMKLKPQTYDKRMSLDPTGIIETRETGLMAQDVWYDAPEMRHVVVVNETANPTPEKPPSATNDPRDDPDYSTWGDGMSTIDYTQLISYLIKGFQEIVLELPRVKNPVVGEPGLIVSSSGFKDTLTVSTIPNDPAWFGVISSEKGLVDTKGQTRIWVVDTNGSLNIGDLVTTASVPGHTQKQDDGILRNVSVAKVTQTCSFTEPTHVPILRPKREERDVTYYIAQRETIISQSDYDQIGQERKRRKETVPMYEKDKYIEITPKKYDSLPVDEKTDYTLFQKTIYYRVENFETKYPRASHPIVEVRQEMVDVLDENGQTVWEDTSNTVPVYTLVDHGTYKAALVTCKLI